MTGSFKVFKYIFFTLGIYLIIVNVILWASGSELNDSFLELSLPNNFNSFHTYDNAYEWKGFQWFFERLSTFPGLYYTVNACNTYANIISNFTITNIGVLDTVLAILRILTTPLILINTVLVDIINTVIWFIGFVS